MAEEDLSRPYVGYRSAGRRPESQQDRVAWANAPLSALRGYVAGTLGLPGDIEGFGRMLIPGVSNESYIPDSEYFRKVLPMRELGQTPTGRAFTEIGGLAGGVGLVTAGKVAGKGAMAAGRAGERMAERVVPQIMERGGLGAQLLQDLATGSRSNAVKPKGGNWLSGSVEAEVSPLKQHQQPRIATSQEEADDLIAKGFVREKSGGEGYYELPNPINKWLDTKLNKYIKNEMGTPDDSVRALAEKYAIDQPAKLAKVQSKIDTFNDKMKQTARERGVSVEDLTSMRQEMIGLEKEKALIEAKKALHTDIAPTGYKMGNIRKKLGLPEEGFGVSPQAKVWEDKSDSVINSVKASDITSSSRQDLTKADPWLLKVPPETPVYGLFGHSNRDLGFDHLIDELRNATNPESGLPKNLLIDMNDLSKITVADAIDRVSDINAWRATQKAEANQLIANNAATVVHKEYPEGYRWVKLTKPKLEVLEKNLPEGYKLRKSDAPFEHQKWQVVNEKGLPAAEQVNANFNYGVPDPKLKALENFFDKKSNQKLKDALKYEGDTMAHCVGSYCEDVASGSTQIFSLRDSKGMPHTTVEVVPSKSNTIKQMKEGNPTDFDIVQIKGKENGAPAEEYLPFVQDFVKSGNWGRVGDLENTGLIDIQDPNAVLRMLQKVSPERNIEKAVDTFNGYIEANPQSSRYITSDEIGKLFNPPPEGFAEGGMVGDPIAAYDPLQIDSVMNSIDAPRAYAEGGSVSVYDPNQIDEIVNQYM
tara:strand:+ start:729 stop:3008 length:2280 start_codon:yes stop_codon:yes gene_type:complete